MKIAQKIMTARIKRVHEDIREVLSDLEDAGSGSVEMFLHDALRHYLAHAEGVNAAIKYGSEYAKGMQATAVAAPVLAPVPVVEDEPPKPKFRDVNDIMAMFSRKKDEAA